MKEENENGKQPPKLEYIYLELENDKVLKEEQGTLTPRTVRKAFKEKNTKPADKAKELKITNFFSDNKSKLTEELKNIKKLEHQLQNIDRENLEKFKELNEQLQKLDATKINPYKSIFPLYEEVCKSKKDEIESKLKYIEGHDKKNVEFKKYVKIYHHLANFPQTKNIPIQIKSAESAKFVDIKHDKANPIVLHFGIYIKELKDITLHRSFIHLIERELIEVAKRYLNLEAIYPTPNKDTCDKQFPDYKTYMKSTSSELPNNVVIIDIFVRGGRDTTLKEITSANIHSVVLWKIDKDKYILIDPNQKKFSSFLTVCDKEIINDGVPDSLYCKGKMTEIEEKEGSIVRDCTDIAVKIAFRLNSQQKQTKECPKTEVESLKINNDPSHVLNKVIKEISNYNSTKIRHIFDPIYSSDKDVSDQADKLVNQYTKVVKGKKGLERKKDILSLKMINDKYKEEKKPAQKTESTKTAQKTEPTKTGKMSDEAADHKIADFAETKLLLENTIVLLGGELSSVSGVE